MDEVYPCDACGRRCPLTQVQISDVRTVCESCRAGEERRID